MEQKISEKMDEFLDKVDRLCWEYGYIIQPTMNGVGDNGEYNTITVVGNDEEIQLIDIDGDGRGK
jgi:hypothetical protein